MWGDPWGCGSGDMVDYGRVPLWVPLYIDMDIWVRLSTVDLEEGR